MQKCIVIWRFFHMNMTCVDTDHQQKLDKIWRAGSLSVNVITHFKIRKVRAMLFVQAQWSRCVFGFGPRGLWSGGILPAHRDWST